MISLVQRADSGTLLCIKIAIYSNREVENEIRGIQVNCYIGEQFKV